MHASVAQRKKLFVDWVPATDLEDPTAKEVLIFRPHKLLLLFLSLPFSVVDKKSFMFTES